MPAIGLDVWQGESCGEPSRQSVCRGASNRAELQGAREFVSLSRAMRIRYIINVDGSRISAGAFLTSLCEKLKPEQPS